MKRATLLLFLASSYATAQLPEAPKPQTLSPAFWAVVASDGAATALDAYSSVGWNAHKCVEVANPELYGLHPQPLRTGLVMGSMWAGSTALAYVAKRHHLRLWKLPLWPLASAWEAQGHTQGFINNFRHCR